jgi:hypothetical protein
MSWNETTILLYVLQDSKVLQVRNPITQPEFLDGNLIGVTLFLLPFMAGTFPLVTRHIQLNLVSLGLSVGFSFLFPEAMLHAKLCCLSSFSNGPINQM